MKNQLLGLFDKFIELFIKNLVTMPQQVESTLSYATSYKKVYHRYKAYF